MKVTRAGLVAVVVCLAVISGCSSSGSGYHEDTYPVAKGHDKHSVVIGQGVLPGSGWSMLAEVNGEGQLCLGVRWTPASGPVDVGCGFGDNQVNDEGRGTEPVAVSQASDGSVLAFGPSPRGAVRARLSSPAVRGTSCDSDSVPAVAVPITHRLPSWYAVRGGWFTTQIPRSALDCVINVVFVDGANKVIAQPNHF